MCVGCKSLKGKALDVYAAGLSLPRRQQVELCKANDPRGRLRLLAILMPMFDEHALEDAAAIEAVG